MLELTELSRGEARLIQVGLRELGYYSGTTQGLPGPKTHAAYRAYLDDQARPQESFADVLARVALGEVGTREEGHNGGPRVREYQAATWYEGGPWPWCAAFVCWCFREAMTAVQPGIQRPTTPGAWAFEKWARKAGAELIKPVGEKLAKRGDIVVFTFSHVGIVCEDQLEPGDYIKTVEGNTNAAGAREGDGVWQKSRKAKHVRSLIRL